MGTREDTSVFVRSRVCPCACGSAGRLMGGGGFSRPPPGTSCVVIAGGRVIHPCVHPEEGPAPDTEEKMFAAICRYIDRLVAAVRPRCVLYLAIDGVAPRAKMNQQRSRRFKAAQEMQDIEEIEAEKRRELESRGIHVPLKPKQTFDHNVITPGTGEWLARCKCRLSQVVKYPCTKVMFLWVGGGQGNGIGVDYPRRSRAVRCAGWAKVQSSWTICPSTSATTSTTV
jgi:hypothetical protein